MGCASRNGLFFCAKSAVHNSHAPYEVVLFMPCMGIVAGVSESVTTPSPPAHRPQASIFLLAQGGDHMIITPSPKREVAEKVPSMGVVYCIFKRNPKGQNHQNGAQKKNKARVFSLGGGSMHPLDGAQKRVKGHTYHMSTSFCVQAEGIIQGLNRLAEMNSCAIATPFTPFAPAGVHAARDSWCVCTRAVTTQPQPTASAVSK